MSWSSEAYPTSFCKLIKFISIPNDVYTGFICKRIMWAPIVIMITEKRQEFVIGAQREASNKP